MASFNGVFVARLETAEEFPAWRLALSARGLHEKASSGATDPHAPPLGGANSASLHGYLADDYYILGREAQERRASKLHARGKSVLFSPQMLLLK
jgi:hypothetical protein